MISASLFLLADAHSSFLLVGRDQAFALLHGPFANLPRLLISCSGVSDELEQTRSTSERASWAME